MSGEKNVPEKIHSELGASVASRWMACPGSLRLIRQVPPAPTTEFAQEGTRAHALAELALTKGVDPDMWLGLELEGGEVDDEMVEFVRLYVNHCREIMAECGGTYWIERKFSLLPLQPPAPMFGTADFVAYDAVSKTLHVVDLKYGRGVVVEAKGNKQLRYYGLGSALSLDGQYPIEKVVMTIVQPRAGHPDGPIRSDEISYLELVEFAAELIQRAKATQDPNAPLAAGSHCTFCPAAALCPEKVKYAQSLAQIEFSVGEEPSIPPAPEIMPMSMLLEMLPQMDILENWIKACRAHVFNALQRGEDVPGWKLVQKRAQRKWADDSVVQQYLEAAAFTSDEIFTKKLKSPAQIEKLLGKKEFATSPIAAIVVKESSGYNLAPDSDPRPAVTVTAGEEFAGLLTGE